MANADLADLIQGRLVASADQQNLSAIANDVELANDLDADGSDKVFAVDLNTAVSVTPPASNNATLITSAGAAVSIAPATTPLRGSALAYDPRTAFNYLPAGARVTDTFAYSIIDVGSGAVGSFADGGAGGVIRLAKGFESPFVIESQRAH